MLPRILIIDDLFGRSVADGPNTDRSQLCAQYLISDVTGDDASFCPDAKVKLPLAEAVFCRGQKPALARVGDTVENDLAGTLEVIRNGWFGGKEPVKWALVLLDLCFYTGLVTKESNQRNSGMPIGHPSDDQPRSYFGLNLLDAIREAFPDLPIVILSSQPKDQVARDYAKRGALAFIARSGPKAAQVLKQHLNQYGLLEDPDQLIVGRSKAILVALRAARQAAISKRNILIRGERGVGKELMARYIHRMTGGGSRPLVTVDSGALSPSLYASELFGHQRGAFTGADRDRRGRVLQANNGDLFLDEIGNMPADVQVGLLRVLEQKEVFAIGAPSPIPVDVRFLSATNEDIEEQSSTGGFRADLLDRLRDGGTVSIPPLRERPEDIPLLIQSWIKQSSPGEGQEVPPSVEDEALSLLQSYSWPGNIREMRSCLFGALTKFPDVEHLFPGHFNLPTTKEAASTRPSQASNNQPSESTGVALTDLLLAIEAQIPVQFPADELVGLLTRIETASTRLQASVLRSALIATLRRTLENPGGEILIHPAVKLVTGDKTLSASKAADIVKRILNSHNKLHEEMMQDPLLREAFERAVTLRPMRKAIE